MPIPQRLPRHHQITVPLDDLSEVTRTCYGCAACGGPARGPVVMLTHEVGVFAGLPVVDDGEEW